MTLDGRELRQDICITVRVDMVSLLVNILGKSLGCVVFAKNCKQCEGSNTAQNEGISPEDMQKNNNDDKFKMELDKLWSEQIDHKSFQTIDTNNICQMCQQKISWK